MHYAPFCQLYLPLDGILQIHIYLSSLGILGTDLDYFPNDNRYFAIQT